MRIRRAPLLFAILLALLVSPVVCAQTAALRQVRVEGQKYLTEEQIASLTELTRGAQGGRKELQDGADALVRTGLFAKVNFKYDTHNDNLVVTFNVEENQRLPVSYDNFPWYSDSEL